MENKKIIVNLNNGGTSISPDDMYITVGQANAMVSSAIKANTKTVLTSVCAISAAFLIGVVTPTVIDTVEHKLTMFKYWLCDKKMARDFKKHPEKYEKCEEPLDESVSED